MMAKEKSMSAEVFRMLWVVADLYGMILLMYELMRPLK